MPNETAPNVSTTGEHKGPVNYSDGTQVNVNPVFHNKPEFHFGDMGAGGVGEARPIPVRVEETEPAVVAPEPIPAPDETAPTEEEDPRDARIRELEERLSNIETRLDEILEALTAPPPAEDDDHDIDDDDTEDDTEEETATADLTHEQNMANLESILVTARDELAKLTIRRKARMSDRITPRGRRDAQAYQEALDNYMNALQLRAGLMREMGQEGGIDDEHIRREITMMAYGEMKKFADREMALNTEMLDEEIANSTWKKPWTKRAKLMKKWAGYSTKKKLLIGLGLAGGTALISGTAGLGIAFLAAGSAAKFSLSLLNRRASARNFNQAGLDKQKLHFDRQRQAELAEILGDDPDQLSSRLEELMGNVTGEKSEIIRKAQRRNKIGNALLAAAGITVGLGISGVGIPGVFEHHGGGGGGNHNLPGSGYHNVAPVGPDRITGVNLPQGMDLIHSGNGHLAIYDTLNHQEILNGGSLPKGLFDQQGNLSVAGREFFRSRGFSLDQATRLAGRFMTTIGGPKG